MKRIATIIISSAVLLGTNAAIAQEEPREKVRRKKVAKDGGNIKKEDVKVAKREKARIKYDTKQIKKEKQEINRQ